MNPQNAIPMRLIRRSGLLVLLALLVLAGETRAQSPLRSHYIEVTGFTLSRDSLQPVMYATVVNQRSSMGTITAENGYFTISALQGDTIAFTAIGYTPLSYVVPAKVPLPKTLKVILTPRTYELSEVLVGPYSEEQLKKDILALKIPEEKGPQINLPAIVQPGLSEDVIFTGSGVAVQGPISALYNKFSRRGKELREITALRSSDEKKRVYQAKMNRDFVARVTGLKNEALEEFLSYCHPAENFVLTANEYDLTLALRECLQRFKFSGNQSNN